MNLMWLDLCSKQDLIDACVALLMAGLLIGAFVLALRLWLGPL